MTIMYDTDSDDACENCSRLDCPAAYGADINACQMLQHREGMRHLDDGTEVGGGLGTTVAEAKAAIIGWEAVREAVMGKVP